MVMVTVMADLTTSARKTAQRLEATLDQRVTMEQARGIVSQAADCSRDDALGQLQVYAANRNCSLVDTASSLENGSRAGAEMVTRKGLTRRGGQ